MEKIGFSKVCAELWAYNSQNTKKACIGCDELRSVSAYKYGSDRTRRNSGIISGIQRRAGEVDVVDHGRYFKGKQGFQMFPKFTDSKEKSSQQN